MDEFFDNVTNLLKADQDELLLDFKTILEESFDTIYVADGTGLTLRASASTENIFGCRPESLVGRNIYDLEREGVFRPSATRLALEKKEKTYTFQQTQTGRHLFTITIPRLNIEGEVTRVISISKDVTDTVMLEQELAQTRKKLQDYYRRSDRAGNELTDERPLVYCSHRMEEICQVAQRIAEFDSTVLLLGESGVGKENVARMIHDFSPRIDAPFIKLNCSAIPDHLLESELFGYDKGAFTGAFKNKPGLFEMANKGTLFLDEIGDLSVALQPKLLRAIQERESLRVGGTRPVLFDVRIIAATNRDLETMVNEGQFRKDLYYRLNIVPLTIPPLRDRPEDIVPLLHYFLLRLNKRFGCAKQLSSEALDFLMTYDWPGNVRELENLVERLLLTATGDSIEAADLPEEIVTSRSGLYRRILTGEIPQLKQLLAEVEAQVIELALQKYQTTTAAAKVLGISQSAVSRKRAQYQKAYSGATENTEI